jgi:hypothetical protein
MTGFDIVGEAAANINRSPEYSRISSRGGALAGLRQVAAAATIRREVSWFLTACLWTHVAVASWWILSSIIMALAGALMGPESVEAKDFMMRVVPKFNRVNAFAAAILLGTGIANIFNAAGRRNFVFSADFTWILEMKVALYITMVAALVLLFGIERNFRMAPYDEVKNRTGRLVMLSGLIAMAGAGAMLLGVWLVGE